MADFRRRVAKADNSEACWSLGKSGNLRIRMQVLLDHRILLVDKQNSSSARGSFHFKFDGLLHEQ
ncbi:MAG: hypothetical protein U0992_09250 [Planctomycetaceae bacterium]